MLVHRRRPLISKPWSQSNRPGWRLKSGSPTTNPISIGSTGLGIHQTPTRTASIKARHGKHLKSTWTTAALWFSNTPDAAHRPQKTTAAKINLGKAVWKSTLEANENLYEFSRFRRSSAFCGVSFLSEFQFSAFQLYRNSPFPPQPPFPRPPV